MAYIKTIGPRLASADVREAYRALGAVTGTALSPQIVRLFSLRASSMRRMVDNWESAMWVGSPPRASRELLAAMISRLNDCDY
jgi:hypothetical protein